MKYLGKLSKGLPLNLRVLPRFSVHVGYRTSSLSEDGELQALVVLEYIASTQQVVVNLFFISLSTGGFFFARGESDNVSILCIQFPETAFIGHEASFTEP